MAAADEPYVPAMVPPDRDRDARVAARRVADAARAGRALDRMFAAGDGPPMAPEIREAFGKGYSEGFHDGWSDGYAASELHHNGHYGVSLPTGGEMPEGERDS